ncbi:MAG: AAA family ATPase [Thermomicrobiales bacterium]
MLPVGQDAIRAMLLDDLSAAVDGTGGVVIVGGEAGIGKTTLVRSLAREAEQRRVRVVEAGCFDLHSTPAFGPWVDVFDNLGRDPSTPAPPPAFARGGAIERVVDQAALFASVRDYFIELTLTGPVLLILEDLHWSDPASIDLLRELGRRASQMRLLIVVTYRTDDLMRQSPFYLRLPALIRETGGHRIELHRLDHDQLRMLVDRWLKLSPSDTERLVEYLELHSDGNPFFATELIRALEDRGVLACPTGEWELAELDQLVLPPLLMHVIDSRVSRLGNATREHLAIASVIGKDVPLSIWSDVAGIDDDDLIGVVERAVDTHLMEADHQGTTVRFVHALTRNALYESVLPPRRREWHRSVANSLMATPHPNPDAVAHHLQMAGDPDAWRWFVKAAERARSAYAWTTATERYRAAIEQLRAFEPEERTVEGKLLYTLAFIQRFSAPAEALEAVEQARRLPGLRDDPLRNAESLWALGTLSCYANRFGDGFAYYDTMIETLQPLIGNVSFSGPSMEQFMGGEVFSQRPVAFPPGDPAPQVSAEMSLADLIDAHLDFTIWSKAAAGILGPAKERLVLPSRTANAIQETRVVLEYSAPWVFLGRAIGAATLGLKERASDDFAESRARFRLLSHHALEAQAVLIESADVAATYRLNEPSYRRLLASEGELALRRAGGALRSGLSPRISWLRSLVLDGNWAEATDILEGSSVPGSAFLWRNVRWATATLARYRGDAQTAWDQIHQIFPDGPDLPPGQVIFHEGLELQRLAANLCLDAGDPASAREWLHAHDRWIAWCGSALGIAAGELGWARLLWAESNDESATLRANDALRRASDLDQPGVRLDAHRLLGEIALRTGRIDEAVVESKAALELAETCELPYERALAQLLLSEARLEAGGRSEAKVLLNEAIATLSLLEAEPALRNAEALASRMGLKPPELTRSPELSERELEVLRLIVAGRSNQAIADDLFISWTTARTHVSNIFRKLEVSSRAEAVDAAHRRGLIQAEDDPASHR